MCSTLGCCETASEEGGPSSTRGGGSVRDCLIIRQALLSCFTPHTVSVNHDCGEPTATADARTQSRLT